MGNKAEHKINLILVMMSTYRMYNAGSGFQLDAQVQRRV